VSLPQGPSQTGARGCASVGDGDHSSEPRCRPLLQALASRGTVGSTLSAFIDEDVLGPQRPSVREGRAELGLASKPPCAPPHVTLPAGISSPVRLSHSQGEGRAGDSALGTSQSG